MVHLFHLRLSASARAVTLAFLGEDQAALLEGHAVAFAAPRRGARPDPLRQPAGRGGAGAARVGTGSRPSASSRCAPTIGFDSFFCEPGERGAHEKGGVEGEVGRFRRRHLVPVPRVASHRRARRAARRRRPQGRAPPRRRPARDRGPGLRGGAAASAPAARRALRRRPAAARPGSTARPGCASASAGTRCPRASPAGDVAVRLGARTVEVAPRGPGRRPPRAQPREGQPDAAARPLSRGPRAQAGRPAVLAHARPGARERRLHDRPRALLEAGETEARRRRRHPGAHRGAAAPPAACRSSRSTPRSTPWSGWAPATRRSWPSRPAASPTAGARPRSPSTGPSGRGWSRPVPVLAGYDALLGRGAAR